MSRARVMVCDSATRFGPEHRDAVVVCGSHGAAYPAYLSARAGLRAVILSDAGVGLDQAGIACLEFCGALGMACATVDVWSARIGDAQDIAARGRISHLNAPAAAAGCAVGQPVGEAAVALTDAPAWTGVPPAHGEGRWVVHHEPGAPRVVCVDSVSLALPEDAGQVVVTGSHGGLFGGRPETALPVAALAALFNDAGIGVEEAGIARLPALEARGIAAATVDAMSARIGDGCSTYEDGILTRANAPARAHGAAPGMPARAFVARLRAGR